jgi:leucyl aminopeptidase
MDYSIEITPLEKLQSDCIIVGVYEDQQLTPAAMTLDNSTQGIISNIVSRGDISGKNGETLLINVIPDSFIGQELPQGAGGGHQQPEKAANKIRRLLPGRM